MEPGEGQKMGEGDSRGNQWWQWQMKEPGKCQEQEEPDRVTVGRIHYGGLGGAIRDAIFCDGAGCSRDPDGAEETQSQGDTKLMAHWTKVEAGTWKTIEELE